MQQEETRNNRNAPSLVLHHSYASCKGESDPMLSIIVQKDCWWCRSDRMHGGRWIRSPSTICGNSSEAVPRNIQQANISTMRVSSSKSVHEVTGGCFSPLNLPIKGPTYQCCSYRVRKKFVTILFATVAPLSMDTSVSAFILVVFFFDLLSIRI